MLSTCVESASVLRVHLCSSAPVPAVPSWAPVAMTTAISGVLEGKAGMFVYLVPQSLEVAMCIWRMWVLKDELSIHQG